MPFLAYLEMASYVLERVLGTASLREMTGNRLGYMALGGLIAFVVYKSFSRLDASLRAVPPELRPPEKHRKMLARRLTTTLFFGMPVAAFAFHVYRASTAA